MPNAFAQAAANAAAPAPTGKKKDQNIVILDAEDHPDVITAIDEFIEADGREKQAKSDKEVSKGVAVPHCLQTFLEQYAAKGKQPPTTKFRTPGGNQVTFVIQDRGEIYAAKPEQVETITAIVGEAKAATIILTDTKFSFNNAILNKPGVMDKLGHAIAELVTSGTITEADGDNILVAEARTTVRKGVVEELATICENDQGMMEQLLAALGSHSTQYIKA